MKNNLFKSQVVAIAATILFAAFFSTQGAIAADLSSINPDSAIDLPAGLPEYYKAFVIDNPSSESVVGYSVPYDLEFQFDQHPPVNDVGIFDHPFFADAINFSKSPSEIILDGIAKPFYAQDYFAIPGVSLNPNTSDACKSYVADMTACKEKIDVTEKQNCIDSARVKFKDSAEGLKFTEYAAALKRSLAANSNLNSLSDGLEKLSMLAILSNCASTSQLKIPELSLADVRTGLPHLVANVAQWEKPYENGFPLAFSAHDATVISGPNGSFEGIASLFYKGQPETNADSGSVLNSNIAYYKMGDDKLLHLYTFVSALLSNPQKCNIVKNVGPPLELKTVEELFSESKCLADRMPTAIASPDMDGDGYGDIITVNRGGISTKAFSFANLYLHTTDANMPFAYAGFVMIGSEPYSVEPSRDRKSVFIATKTGVSQLKYDVAQKQLISTIVVPESLFPSGLAEGYRPYHVAAVDNPSGCDNLAVTWALIGPQNTEDYSFEDYFSYYYGSKDGSGICVYEASQKIVPFYSAIPTMTKPMIATVAFAPAIPDRGISAGLWVGNQRISLVNEVPSANAWLYKIGTDGSINQLLKTSFKVSGDMSYTTSETDESQTLPGCGVKQQRVDRFGNLITVIGCPKVFTTPSNTKTQSVEPVTPPVDYIDYKATGCRAKTLIIDGAIYSSTAFIPPYFVEDKSWCPDDSAQAGFPRFTNDLDCDGVPDYYLYKPDDNISTEYIKSTENPCDNCRVVVTNGNTNYSASHNPDQADADKDTIGDRCALSIIPLSGIVPVRLASGSVTVMINKTVKSSFDAEECNCGNYKSLRMCAGFDSSVCSNRLPPCTCDMRLIDPTKCDVAPLGEFHERSGTYAACECGCRNYMFNKNCKDFDFNKMCNTGSQPLCTCSTVNGAVKCDPKDLGAYNVSAGKYAKCIDCTCADYKSRGSECPNFAEFTLDANASDIPDKCDEACSCTNYTQRNDCPAAQYNSTTCGGGTAACTCDDYLERGSACPNYNEFLSDTNGNGVADKCDTITGVVETSDCVLLVGVDGSPAVGIGPEGTDYDKFVRQLNRRVSEIYCNEVIKRGGACDPDANPHHAFVGELGVVSARCAQPIKPLQTNVGAWQISGYPLGPDAFGESGYRWGQLADTIDMPDGTKMSRSEYLTNTATRLFAVDNSNSSSGKALLATSVATDVVPSIVAARRQFVNTSLASSLSSGPASFSVSVGNEASPYMVVKMKQVNADISTALKSIASASKSSTGLGTASPSGKTAIIEVTARAPLDGGQFYAPSLQVSSSRNFDSEKALRSIEKALANQPTDRPLNFSKAMEEANQDYPWDEYMHVTNVVGDSQMSYNIVPLYYVGSSGKSGFGCSLIR